MDRLTVNDLNNVRYDPWELCGMDSYCKKGCHEEGGCTKGCHILKMYRKLAEYEDLEEQGKLLKLPCKIGDIIWVNGVLGVGKIEKHKVIKVDYHSTLGTGRSEFYIEALLENNPKNSIGFYDKEIGKTVFLTIEGAERALAVMEGKK